MKTINWSVLHFKVFDGKKNSLRNTIAKLRQKIAQRLDYLGERWVNLSSYSEPKIWERKGRDGNSYFRIYDPIHDSYIYFNSEEEVRAWPDKCDYL